MATAQEQPITLENEHLVLLVSRAPESKMRYEVTVKPALVQESHKKAVKAVKGRVSIPGFRKGKLPDSIIEERFAEDITGAHRDIIARETLNACDRLRKLDIIKNGKLDASVKELSKDSATILYLFEIEPIVPDVNTSALTYTKAPRTAVTDADVEAKLNHLQLLLGKTEPLADRPFQDGDILNMKVNNLAIDKEMHLTFEYGDKKTIPWPNILAMPAWMKNLLQGKSLVPGSPLIVEGMSEIDDSASEEVKARMQPANFRLEVVSAFILTPATLTEEMIQEHFKNENAPLKTAADLTDHLRKILATHAEKIARDAERESLNQSLIEQLDFDVPATLVEQEERFRLRGMQAEGTSLSEAEMGELRLQCTRAIRLFYTTQKIIKDQKITFSNEDLNRYPTPLAHLFFPEDSEGFLNESKDQQLAERYSRLLMEKAQDHLFSGATAIEGVKVLEESASAPAEPKSKPKAPAKKAASKTK